jgi:hypothetical protein
MKQKIFVKPFKDIVVRRSVERQAPAPVIPQPPQHALAVDLITSGIPPHPQGNSALFSILPPDIRNQVFYLTLLEYDDEATPVPFDSYGYRPGHEYRKKHSLDLLATCKRAYLESYLIPVATTTHITWSVLCYQIPPLDRLLRAYRPFKKMTIEQRAAVGTVHLYEHQYTLGAAEWERPIINKDQRTSGVCPKRLIITVRRYDWVGWETDAPLSMEYGSLWRKCFEAFPFLEEFVIELETLERRQAELNAVAERVRKWKIGLGNGRVLKTDGIALKTHTWNASAKLFPHTEGAASLPCYVVTVTWKVQSS